MSLAMSAAPFEDDSNENRNNENNYINKKRQHNKTQKRNIKENFDTGNFNTDKVNSILETIHNNSNTDDDDNLGNYDLIDSFEPPPKPISSGVNRTIPPDLQPTKVLLGKNPEHNGDNLEMNNINYNYGNNKSTEEYYKKMLPGYSTINNETKGMNILNPNNRQYHNSSNETNSSDFTTNDVLLQKLNYMINLLEEQQDEKTNNVTEEVVLYSFLGIFIIFVVDSFARVGKYVR